MAVVTEAWAITRLDGNEARVEVDYDDTTGPDFDLVRARVVNNLTRPVRIVMQRGNGRSFWNVEVAGQSTDTADAGGPVKRISDLPVFELRTV